MDERKLIPIELEPVPRTKKEICAITRHSYPTLRRKLLSQDVSTTKGLLDPHLQERIFKILGYRVEWRY